MPDIITLFAPVQLEVAAAAAAAADGILHSGIAKKSRKGGVKKISPPLECGSPMYVSSLKNQTKKMFQYFAMTQEFNENGLGKTL